ncbi:MAG: UDP-N-acetylglucosamine--N-acetylmuramyl-(pentapeptide) pyrophosphoryl-undecaprenol N-acetylglucosamine transferase [bacterium]|nr:UDP-N-acetylglucosamine--N-acetylmuramyl-(pentapeptide) pyrophosphoryl-undecaprenol N-acetylglucosamine transferase [bacterium]
MTADHFKFIVCAGGTGGHILPGLSIYEELKKEKHEVKFVCRKKDLNLIEELKQISKNLFFLNGIGLRRSLSLRNILFLYYLAVNLIKTFLLFLRFSPDRVVCMGGYITFPVLLMSFFFRIPFYLCEQNSHPGLVNKMFGRFSQEVFVNFAYTRRFFKKVIVAGNPVRDAVQEAVDRTKAFHYFRFREKKPVLLIMGGSQGSLRLNYSVAGIFHNLQRFNIIWLVGKKNFNEFKKYRNEGIQILPYLEKMNYAYSIADMALSRAGAMSITELAYYGIAALFIPLALATNNHQLINAGILAKAKAGELLEEKNLYSDILQSRISHVYQNRSLYRLNIRKFYVKESTGIIVSRICRPVRSRA